MNWGQVANYIVGSIPAVLAVLYSLHRIERRLILLMVEHEILIKEYCEGKKIKPEDLPTRARAWK